jgi:hypothetical protein
MNFFTHPPWLTATLLLLNSTQKKSGAVAKEIGSLLSKWRVDASTP